MEGDLAIAAVADLLDDPQWTRAKIGADLSGQSLRRLDVAQCRFESCRLTGADLQGARFVDVAFNDCELSGAAMADAVLTRVEFRNCRMSGLILSSAKLRDVSATDCKIDGLSMRMATTERLLFERCLLRDADLGGSRLEFCRLFDCDLTSSDFSKTTFRDARFHGSDLAGLRGVEQLRGITIDSEQMHDFALSLLAAHDVMIDDDREAEATP
jgi:uncharacterized protein YjbI with pentapeptide repeats